MIQIGRQLFDEDKDTRIYHTPVKMLDVVTCGFAGMPTDSPIVQALLDIPGVEYAEVHPYYLAIKKARMYEWGLIETSVKRLVSTFVVEIELVNRPDET